MPEKFGRLATVEAEIIKTNIQLKSEKEIPPTPFKKGGVVHVRTENVSSFSLDLRTRKFLKFKNWEIVIDSLIFTNCASGEMFSYEFKLRNRSFAQRKRNGFCGGIADVVCDSFLFAYSADDLKSKMRAERFNIAITGIKPYQFDGNFKVVPDTELTPELCAKYNVILFASSEKPGKFLKENIENLPFEIVKGKLEFNHANISTSSTTAVIHKQDACVTFPNPIASNRYLLTVTMTNFTPRILMSERNDIILGGKCDSFDVNWNKIQSQDEHKAHNCESYGHDQNQEQSSKNQLYKSEIKSKEPKWKKIGGIIFLIIFGGAGLYYLFALRKVKN